jgi:hypothetical protein
LFLPLVGVVALAALAAGGVMWLGRANAASIAAAEAKTAAFAALEEEYLVLGSEDEGALDLRFAGSARDSLRDLRDHIRELIAQGADYPGGRSLSNIEILSITVSDATTVAIEFTAHVRLANMKAGKTVDFSEADEICRVVMIVEGGAWKVDDVRWKYLPGSGP